MKRNVVDRCTNPNPSLGDALRGRTYQYTLDCGHNVVRLPRTVKGSKVHPKTLDCTQCD